MQNPNMQNSFMKNPNMQNPAMQNPNMQNNNNNKNIYLPPKNTSTVMLGTGDYVYSNSGNTKVKI